MSFEAREVSSHWWPFFRGAGVLGSFSGEALDSGQLDTVDAVHAVPGHVVLLLRGRRVLLVLDAVPLSEQLSKADELMLLDCLRKKRPLTQGPARVLLYQGAAPIASVSFESGPMRLLVALENGDAAVFDWSAERSQWHKLVEASLLVSDKRRSAIVQCASLANTPELNLLWIERVASTQECALCFALAFANCADSLCARTSEPERSVFGEPRVLCTQAGVLRNAHVARNGVWLVSQSHVSFWSFGENSLSTFSLSACSEIALDSGSEGESEAEDAHEHAALLCTALDQNELLALDDRGTLLRFVYESVKLGPAAASHVQMIRTAQLDCIAQRRASEASLLVLRSTLLICADSVLLEVHRSGLLLSENPAGAAFRFWEGSVYGYHSDNRVFEIKPKPLLEFLRTLASNTHTAMLLTMIAEFSPTLAVEAAQQHGFHQIAAKHLFDLARTQSSAAQTATRYAPFTGVALT